MDNSPLAWGTFYVLLVANGCLELEHVTSSRWLKAMQKHLIFVGVVHWQCPLVSVDKVSEEQFVTEGYGDAKNLHNRRPIALLTFNL